MGHLAALRRRYTSCTTAQTVSSFPCQLGRYALLDLAGVPLMPMDLMSSICMKLRHSLVSFLSRTTAGV